MDGNTECVYVLYVNHKGFSMKIMEIYDDCQAVTFKMYFTTDYMPLSEFCKVFH